VVDGRLGVEVGQDVRGFAGYLVGYQVLTSAASRRSTPLVAICACCE